MSSHWYAIQILQNLEATAELRLKQQTFRFFSPKFITKLNKAEPLFKSYGFVQFDMEKDRWRSINGTVGVVRLLPKHLEIPLPLAEGFVEYFIDTGPIKENQNLVDIIEEFYPGALIKITENNHLLDGKNGIVKSIRGKFLEILCDGELWRNSILIRKTSVVIRQE